MFHIYTYKRPQATQPHAWLHNDPPPRSSAETAGGGKRKGAIEYIPVYEYFLKKGRDIYIGGFTSIHIYLDMYP